MRLLKRLLVAVGFDGGMVALLLVASTALCLGAERSIFRWPMTAEFPVVARSIDGSTLGNDFYTVAATHSPKVIFAWAVAAMTKLSGDWYATLTMIHVVVQVTLRPLIFLLLVGCGAWWGVVGSVKWNGLKLVAALLLLMNHSAMYRVLLAGWDSFLSLPLSTPMIISIWLCLISANLVVRARRVTFGAFAFQLVATLTHPVLAICCWAVWGAILLPLAERKFFRSFVLLGVLGAAAPAGVIGWLFSPEHPLSARDYVAWYVMDRHPHHYRMSTSVYPGFWQFVVLWSIPIALSWSLPFRHRILALGSLGTMGGAVLLQYLGTEVFPCKLVAEFGPSRYTSLMVMLWILTAAIVAGARWSTPLIDRDGSSENVKAPSLPWGFVSAVALLAVAALFWQSPREAQAVARQAKALPVIEWIEKHTGVDDVFLTNQGTFDSFWIRILARRAVAGDDAFPFSDDAMPEFFARRKLYQSFVGNPAGFLAAGEAPFRCDYVVLKRALVPVGMPIVFESPEWAVLAFKRRPPAP